MTRLDEIKKRLSELDLQDHNWLVSRVEKLEGYLTLIGLSKKDPSIMKEVLVFLAEKALEEE